MASIPVIYYLPRIQEWRVDTHYVAVASSPPEKDWSLETCDDNNWARVNDVLSQERVGNILSARLIERRGGYRAGLEVRCCAILSL